LKMSQTTL